MVENIIEEINRALAEPGVEKVAAFDADGTLWDCDFGENFFHYQINNGLLEGLPENPWDYYINLHDNISAVDSYLWLAQINVGHPIDEVRNWAKAAMNECGPIPIFPDVKKIIDHLQSSGVSVYIITASIQWAVEPGATLFNIPIENVVGVQTKIIDGVVSKEQDGPITYREGKVDGLTHRNGGLKPFFAAGNTQGDLPLLESASHIRFVNAANKSDNSNYTSEREMLKLAADRGWFFKDHL